jgi:hypothetical protein
LEFDLLNFQSIDRQVRYIASCRRAIGLRTFKQLLNVFAVLSIVILVTKTPASADWINLTGAEIAPNIAEISVEDTGVAVSLEIYVGDIEKFSDLIPASWFKNSETSPEPDARRLDRFANEGLSIRDDQGNNLPLELRLLERRERVDRASPFAGKINPYTGTKEREPPSDKRVLYAELFYPFAGVRPEQLTFTPPLNADGISKVSIGMIVRHHKMPVIDFRYLSGAATLNLDWEDPWYSRFDERNLTRHHKYPRMAFLYAEPYEIRFEALLRVRDALEIAGLEVNTDRLGTKEITELRDGISAALLQHSQMTIDGNAVMPDFDRAAFMRIGLRGLEIMNDGEPVEVDSTIIGLIFSAAKDGLPKRATVNWTLFNPREPEVPGYAIDAAGPFLMQLTPEDPLLVWTNHFKRSPYPPVSEVAAKELVNIDFPALSFTLWIAALLTGVFALRSIRRNWWLALLSVSLVALGVASLPIGTISIARPSLAPAKLTEEQAAALSQQLLTNIYRSFDFRGEEQVYDRLAKTVDGQLLEQVYLDQRRSLRIARAGNAQARVKAVFVESSVPDHIEGTGADFVLRTRWNIVGNVGHWGHSHQRSNRYEADLMISPVNGAWKIQGFNVLDQERLSP